MILVKLEAAWVGVDSSGIEISDFCSVRSFGRGGMYSFLGWGKEGFFFFFTKNVIASFYFGQNYLNEYYYSSQYN